MRFQDPLSSGVSYMGETLRDGHGCPDWNCPSCPLGEGVGSWNKWLLLQIPSVSSALILFYVDTKFILNVKRSRKFVQNKVFSESVSCTFVDYNFLSVIDKPEPRL